MKIVNGVRWVQVKPAARSAHRRHRGLIASGAVVAVLVGAIALAGQGDGGRTGPTAELSTGSSLADAVRSERGAAGAAARYAALLGGEAMFTPEARRAVVDSIAAPAARGRLQTTLDEDYTSAFNARIGLDSSGRPPAGRVFVSRTMPAGTSVTKYSLDAATVAVWCSGLFGVTGPDSKAPVTTSWFTVSLSLQWSAGGWKVTGFTQTEGPDPSERAEFGQAPPL